MENTQIQYQARHKIYHLITEHAQNKTPLDTLNNLNGLDKNTRKTIHITVQQLKRQSNSTKHCSFSEICPYPIRGDHKYRRSIEDKTLSSGYKGDIKGI